MTMPEAALAQKRPECSQVYEIITPLRAPMFGSSSMWRRMIGIEGMDRFVGAVPLENNFLLTMGETRSMTDTDTHILFAELNHLGRIMWEKRIKSKGLKKISSAESIGNQIAILGQIEKDKKKGLSLLFFDKAGALLRKKEFWDKEYDLTPEYLLEAGDQGGYLLALATGKETPTGHAGQAEKDEQHTVIIRFSTSGNELWRRAYLIGTPNRMFSLSLLDNGSLIGAGHILLDDGRNAGWLVRINDEGGIQWRRTFPRGRFAELKTARQLRNKSFIAAGNALPSTGPDSAGWVLNVDEVGNPVWQRFYTGRYAYTSHDLTTEKDGRTTVLMNAAPIKTMNAGRSHIRLLTLSPEGYTMRDDAYIEGAHSEAYRLIRRDNGMRYVAGMAQTGYADPENKKDKTYTTYDAWMMAVPPLEKYADPCREGLFIP